MPLEIRGAHFLIRSAQLVRKTRLELALVYALVDQYAQLVLDALRYAGWLGSRVVSVLDSGAVWPGCESQPRRCRLTVIGKLFTPIVLLFTKQRNC